ncbi:MAG: S8 family serine peptidase [Dehalococcoidia bacterium]
MFFFVVATLTVAFVPENLATGADSSCEPVIESVTPSSVFVGGTITIHGSCLWSGTPEGGVKISLGEAPIVVTTASATEIVGQVNTPDLANALTLETVAGGAEEAFEVKNWIEPPSGTYKAGIIEVKLKPGSDIGAMVTQLGGHKFEPVFEGWDFQELDGLWSVEVDGDTMARVREWAAHPAVEWAQPDMVLAMQPADFPDDPPDDPCYPDPTPAACDVFHGAPFYGIQYADDGQWGLQRISTEGAWPISQGASSVRLGVIDHAVEIGTGELYQELSSRVAVSRDLTGFGPQPDDNHGTMVAGVAAANTDNGIGVAGVAPNVSIASYKVFGPGNVPAPGCLEFECAVENWEEALLYAVGLDDVDVVNMSLSARPVPLGVYDLALQSVINVAHNAGLVVVASAGNEGFDMDDPDIFVLPAELNNVITVAATDDTDGRADFQFPELGSYAVASNIGTAVDISAPGVDIMSTGGSQTQSGAKYATDSGTSYSAPMVSGVAALLASRGFYACEIVETITGYDQFGDAISADPINWQGGGVGRLNAQDALEWWGGGPILSDTVWPNGAIIHTESDPVRYVINGGKKTQITAAFNERNDQCIPDDLFDSIPWGDSDADGWADNIEMHVGTDRLDACGFTAGGAPESGTWPVDFVESNSINTQDVLAVKAQLGPVPPRPQRYDIVPDNNINIQDVLAVKPSLGLSCTP